MNYIVAYIGMTPGGKYTVRGPTHGQSGLEYSTFYVEDIETALALLKPMLVNFEDFNKLQVAKRETERLKSNKQGEKE